MIQDVSREALAANIEILDVIVTVEILVLGQGDSGPFQVRNVDTKDSAALDIKVATNFEGGDFKATIKGLSAGRSRAKVIVTIEESQVTRRHIIDVGISAVLLDHLKVSQSSSISSMKLVEKSLEVVRGFLPSNLNNGWCILDAPVLDELCDVGLSDKPGAQAVGKVKLVSGILGLKVVNQCLTILSLRARSSSDPFYSILKSVANTALGVT